MSAIESSLRIQSITEAHQAAQTSMRDAVAHAIRAGALLIEAKSAMPHGEFGGFCKALPFSDRTARGYMQLARLDPENRQRVADLSLREALQKLAAPRPAFDDHGIPLSAACETLARLPDDAGMVCIEPSTHAGYFFVTRMSPREAWGLNRPVHQRAVGAVLEALGVRPDLSWIQRTTTPRATNEWLHPAGEASR